MDTSSAYPLRPQPWWHPVLVYGLAFGLLSGVVWFLTRYPDPQSAREAPTVLIAPDDWDVRFDAASGRLDVTVTLPHAGWQVEVKHESWDEATLTRRYRLHFTEPDPLRRGETAEPVQLTLYPERARVVTLWRSMD